LNAMYIICEHQQNGREHFVQSFLFQNLTFSWSFNGQIVVNGNQTLVKYLVTIHEAIAIINGPGNY